jgi:hypothetical protein
MSAAVAEVARAIDLACQAVGARFFVFGAQAAIVRGVVRATEDVDVTVDLRGADIQTFIEALAREQVSLRVSNAEEFIAATRVLPMMHLPRGIPVDVVLSGSGFEDDVFERVEIVPIDGVEVPVAALEDLIVMKTLAGRPRDVEDVTAMLVANPAHDVERIRAALRDLETALDQSDLIPGFESALKKARRAIASKPRG